MPLISFLICYIIDAVFRNIFTIFKLIKRHQEGFIFNMAKYVVIARFPPPLGGVSVFSKRKVDQLRQDHNNVLTVDFGKRIWPVKLAWNCINNRQAIYLVNTLNIFIIAYIFMCGGLSRCVIYDHNASRGYYASPIKKRLLMWFLRRARRIVVVHERLSNFYHSVGIEPEVESPFIPPNILKSDEIISTYPRFVKDFINERESIKIVNSAWRYVVDEAGNDLYGIGPSLIALEEVRKRGIAAKMLFAFGDFDDRFWPQDVRERKNRLEREGALCILSGQKELWPLFRSVDLFLRTTFTDGESVSVNEALYFGCKVIASDAVPRPEKAVLYQVGKTTDLIEKIVIESGN